MRPTPTPFLCTVFFIVCGAAHGALGDLRTSAIRVADSRGMRGQRLARGRMVGAGDVVKELHTAGGYCSTFSPDGATLAYGEPGRLVFMSVENWEQVKSIDVEGSIETCCYSHDGKLLSYGGADSYLYTLDTSTWVTVDDKHKLDSAIHKCAYHPEGIYLSFGGKDGNIVTLNMSTDAFDEVHRDKDSADIRAISYSPNGEFLSYGGNSGRLFTKSTKTWQTVEEFGVDGGVVKASCYSADSKYLSIGGKGIELTTISTETWKTVAIIDEKHEVAGDITTCSYAPQPDVPFMAFGDTEGWYRTVRTDSDPGSWEVVMEQDLEDQISSVTYNPVKHMVACATANFGITIYEDPDAADFPVAIRTITMTTITTTTPAMFGPLRELPVQGMVHTLSFSPDGQYFAIGGSEPGSELAILWATDATGTPWEKAHTIATDFNAAIFASCFSPDSALLTFGGQAGELRTVSVGSWKEVGDAMIFQDDVRSCTYSADGYYLALGLGTGHLIVFNTFNRATVYEVNDATLQIETIRFSLAPAHDGPFGAKDFLSYGGTRSQEAGGNSEAIFTGGFFVTVDIGPLDVSNPEHEEEKIMCKKMELPAPVKAIAYSPDGQFLTYNGGEGIVLISTRDWKDKEIPLESGGTIVTSLAYSPNGKLLTFAERESRTGKEYVNTICMDEKKGYASQDKVEFKSTSVVEGGDMAYSPEGGVLAYGVVDSGVGSRVELRQLPKAMAGERDLYEPESWEEKPEKQVSYTSLLTVAFSPDGKYMSYGGTKGPNGDDTLTVVDAESFEVVHTFQAGQHTFASCWSHDSKLFSFGGCCEGETSEFKTTEVKVGSWDEVEHKDIGTQFHLYTCAYSPTGNFLTVGGDDEAGGGKVITLDETGEKKVYEHWLKLPPHHPPEALYVIRTISYSPKGDIMAYAGNSGNISIIRTTWEHPPYHVIQHGVPVIATCFSPDGKTFSYGGDDKKLTTVDTTYWKPLWDPIPAKSSVYFCNYNKAGTLLTYGGGDKSFELITVKTSTGQIVRLVDHGEDATLMMGSFSPDGETLVAGDSKNQKLLFSKVPKIMSLPAASVDATTTTTAAPAPTTTTKAAPAGPTSTTITSTSTSTSTFTTAAPAGPSGPMPQTQGGWTPAHTGVLLELLLFGSLVGAAVYYNRSTRRTTMQSEVEMLEQSRSTSA